MLPLGDYYNILCLSGCVLLKFIIWEENMKMEWKTECIHILHDEINDFEIANTVADKLINSIKIVCFKTKQNKTLLLSVPVSESDRIVG